MTLAAVVLMVGFMTGAEVLVPGLGMAAAGSLGAVIVKKLRR